MRVVDLEKYKAIRKKLSIYMGMFFGVPVGVILFLLTLGSGFFGALLFGVLVGGAIFALIYVLRELTHKGVDSKRKKINMVGDCIDVLLNGEMGLLEFFDDLLVFHPLTPGGFEKKMEIRLTENVFLGAGEITHTKIQKLKYRNVEEGYVLVKEMPNGIPRQFVFLNIENALEHVAFVVNTITKYQE